VDTAVDARTLKSVLNNHEKGADFSTWVKSQIKRFDLLENTHYMIVNSAKSDVGRKRKEYLLRFKVAHDVAVASSTNNAKLVRKYFTWVISENKLAEVHDKILRALK